jgi:hypothetical protein
MWAVFALCLAAAGCGTAGALERPAAASSVARPSSTPAPVPTFAKNVLIAPVSGKVMARVPGAAAFVRLTSARLVALGTVIDARSGTVRLISATAPPTKLQTGEFFLGRFEVRQNRSLGGLTDFVIRDETHRSTCTTYGPRRPRALAAAKLSPRVLGLLRGKAKGRFRTIGHFAAATVRGTEWGVRDRCDGTLTVVTKGVVSVRDFTLHTTITVRTGETYLAPAG